MSNKLFPSRIQFFVIILCAVQIVLIKCQDCIDSRLRAGKCVKLTECPDVVEDFYDESRKTSYIIDFQTFVSNSMCGFDGNNFLICCRTHVFHSIFTSKPIISSEQNTPELFLTTKGPHQQLYQTTPFLFSKLSGNMPQIDVGNENHVTSDTAGVTFKPTVQTVWTEPAEIYQTVPSTTQASLISQIVHQPIAELNDSQNCGVSPGTINRVVGGAEAKKGNYPWMAALGYSEFGSSSLKFLCGGSLISSKYIITSAHCINQNLRFVRLGAHNVTNSMEAEARNYAIKRIIIHEEFNLKSISNDLALIELNETVVMTKFISPICLPLDSKFLTQDFVGMHPFVAGWGAKKYQGPTSNVLRDVQVPIVNQKVCEQAYPTVVKHVKFSEKLICAGNSVMDACQGDSGGPLMMPQYSESSYSYRFYLLGVVSFGYECARVGFPGVYTKVAFYIPWIKSNMI